MRIGINCRFLHAAQITGVERYAMNLLQGLLQEPTEHSYVLLGGGKKAREFSSRSPIHRIGNCGFRSPALRQVWEQSALPVIARRAGLHVMINPINTAPIGYGRNVIVVHDLSFLEHPQWFGRGFVALYRAIVPTAARRAAAVVTDSEYSKGKIVKLLGIDPSRVHVIYLAADPVFKRVEGDALQSVMDRHSLTKPYALYAGSVAPRKNLGRVISAYERVRERLGSEHELVVVGASSFHFSGNGETSGNVEGVRMLGYVSDDDLAALYSGARVFVFPSLYEGFGLPPLEAMSCGTPVITSNTTSLPEVVGDAAITVDPENTDEIADSLERVLSDDDLAKGLSGKGLERAGSFSWSDTARQMLDVCSNLVGDTR
jgi:glycosyltransferase involved in cell wall biosynthesis